MRLGRDAFLFCRVPQGAPGDLGPVLGEWFCTQQFEPVGFLGVRVGEDVRSQVGAFIATMPGRPVAVVFSNKNPWWWAFMPVSVISVVALV